MASLLYFRVCSYYLLAGVSQSGKKALAAIFAICPRVVWSL